MRNKNNVTGRRRSMAVYPAWYTAEGSPEVWAADDDAGPRYSDDRSPALLIRSRAEADSYRLPALPEEAAVLPPAAARCGNAQRDQVIKYLGDKHAEGFLDDAEYEARRDYALQAKTVQELIQLEADLPLSRHRIARAKAPRAFRFSAPSKIVAENLWYAGWYLASCWALITGIALVMSSVHPHHQGVTVSVLVMVMGALIIAGSVTSVITAIAVSDARAPLQRLKQSRHI